MGESGQASLASRNLSLNLVDVSVVNGCFEVFSSGFGSSLFRLNGARFEFSAEATDPEGEGAIEAVLLQDQVMETNVGIVLDPLANGFRVQLLKTLEKHRQVLLDARVKLEPSLPFQATVGHQVASPIAIEVPRLGRVELVSNQMMVQSGGWLLAPMTWQGLLRFRGRGLSLEDSDLSFDRHGGTIVLRNGLLQIPDAQVVGDQVSVLGNGWLTRDAGAAVLRVVVPDHTAGLVANRLGGGSLKVLEPGNRLYMDLHAWRESGSWFVEQGEVIRPAGEFARDVAAGVGWTEKSSDD